MRYLYEGKVITNSVTFMLEQKTEESRIFVYYMKEKKHPGKYPMIYF